MRFDRSAPRRPHPDHPTPWRPRAASALLCSLLLAACGGGGGGGTETADAPPGFVVLRVTDEMGTPVAGALVTGPRDATRSGADGLALVLTPAPTEQISVTVSLEDFVERTLTAQSQPGGNATTVALERITAPAGGSMGSRSGLPPQVDGTRQRLTFEIELVLVDRKAAPIDGLGAERFTLLPCTPDAADPRADCLRRPGGAPDAGYQPLQPQPEALTAVPGSAPQPHAVALLLDQSGSIAASDATGARLYAAKSFMAALGAGDRALLAAFAGGPSARIATPPLAVYGSFVAQGDSAAVTSAMAVLDSLAGQLGGDTPLYASLDTLGAQVAADASLPAGLARTLVVFTDGADTQCAGVDACRAARAGSVARARAAGQRVFTVGLSTSVDIAALGELATQTGGALLYADDARQLPPLYGSLGRLVSLALPVYRLRFSVQADAPGVFEPGSTLVGRVRVDTGTGPVEVPFVVGVP